MAMEKLILLKNILNYMEHKMQINTIHYKSSTNMNEIDNNSIKLIITSPPYFNIKDYSQNIEQYSENDIGNIDNYSIYISKMLEIWQECQRVLQPNGKLCINVPLMPMLKSELNTHYNRHIFNIASDIEQSILKNTNLYLMDIFIWNRTNATKNAIFGSYPYPSNFYAQNTSEFILVFVKDGKPLKVSKEIKEQSKITQKEWFEYTKHIWNIPIPNKSDIAYGLHPAIMPQEIPYRLIKMYSFVNDIVLDTFAGSGTTLKVAKELNRNYIGYEIYQQYKPLIEKKIS